MKRTLFLASLLACCMSYHASAANYSGDSLTSAWTDGNISYDGSGNFSFLSLSNTDITVTLDLNAYSTHINSENFSSAWLTNIIASGISYGIASNAVQSDSTTQPALIGKISSNTKSYGDADASRAGSLAGYYTEGAESGTLTLTISFRNGSSNSGITVKDANNNVVYNNTSLKYSQNLAIEGCYINTDYISAVSITQYTSDYTEAFESQRTDDTSIGRVTFIGDSITHGVNDMTYRWQFFKILTDNGIENEIVGPLSGNNATPNTRDKGTSYGGVTFNNVHYAEASGRSRNVVAGGQCNDPAPSMNIGSGVTYTYWSAEETEAFYNSDTWFCMLGTNDLLSDTYANGNQNDKNDITTDNYCGRMQVLLGGNIIFTETGEQGSKIGDYTWAKTENWGNMGTIVESVCEEGDTFYMLSIIPWGPAEGAKDGNHDLASDRLAVQEYNENLKSWCDAYSKANNRNVVYVDVTHGMVDQTGGQIDGKSDLPFYAPNQFFNTVNTSDDIHPGEQGSLLMAGNLARAMDLGGRTAGLQRQSTAGWDSATFGKVADGTSVQVAADAFTMEGGYTVDFAASFGNGATNGWLGTDCSLSISVGDGFSCGTLRLTEGYIMWGDSTLLFCWDNSKLAGWDAATTNLSSNGNLRIAWHNGNTSENIMKGYYVWLDDMLIGQGLDASQNITLNGIEISANGADGTITGLSWTNTAYAPTTLGTTSTEYALLTTQTIPTMPAANRNNTPTSSGVDYSGKTAAVLSNDFISTTTNGSGTHTFVLGTQGSFTDANVTILETNPNIGKAKHTGTINTKITGNLKANLVGVKGGATANKLLIEVSEDPAAYVHNLSTNNGAIIAAYNGGSVTTFDVYVNGGGVGGDIVGGESKTGGTGTVGQTNIYINNGTISGNILGGGKSANGSVGNATIRVNGGTITGSIIAGGTAGSIGNTDVTITGGIIKGGIEMGTATRTNNGTANVTIIGNKASIGGNITADNVTLRDVTATPYSDGFDKYAGTISATRLTLDNVQVNLQAALSENITSIELINNTRAGAVLGDTYILQKLLLSDGTSFSAHKQVGTSSTNMTSSMESTLQVSVLEVGMGATLNANLSFSEGSVLRMSDTLTMGSDVALVDGMVLELSESMLQNLYGYNPVVLFSGVDNLTLNGEVITEGSYVNVDGVFTNLNPEFHYNISYVGSYVTLIIPEPATATLSLLALAALAARRRRK